MTEVLFTFDKRNFQNCQNAYRGAGQEEYYLGDYAIEAGPVVEVRADRRTVGAYSIIRVRSKTRMSFRRSWNHIREDAIDVALLWFVKQGELTITHQRGSTLAHAGDFTITKSATPFFVECQIDDNSMYEVLQIVVPNHILRRFFPEDVKTGFCIAAGEGEFAIAEHILRDIFEDDGKVSDESAQHLVESTLQVLSHAVSQRGVFTSERQSLSDKRLQDILRYIEIHLSDPQLNVDKVARGCGISRRYLYALLKDHGVSFSSLVWDKRLEVAKEWLATSTHHQAPVSEIAYKVGFKSPQHFSRRFKRAFNRSPSAYRQSCVREQEREAAVNDPSGHQVLPIGNIGRF